MGDSSFRRHGLHNRAFCGERKMPWKVCRPMDERLKFIARVLEGEQMAGLCREFGISRKTGYKLLGRYNDSGLEALTDRSRRPYRQANKLPFQIETLIVRLKINLPGAHRRSVNGSDGFIPTFTRRRSVPFMQCSIVMGW